MALSQLRYSLQRASMLHGRKLSGFPLAMKSGKASPASKVSLSSLGNRDIGERMISYPSSAEDKYPTRFIKEHVVQPRPDPVVWGRHGPGGLLTKADLDHYKEYGFVIVKDVFTRKKILQDLTEDVMARRDEIEADLAAHDVQEVITGESRSGVYLSESKSKRLRSLYQTVRHIPLVSKLARYPPLLASVKQILDDDAYIFQDRINFQSAFAGEGFDWHSDFEAWHSEDGIPRPRIVNVMVMLSHSSPENGALIVIPGTHKHFFGCPELKFESKAAGSFGAFDLIAQVKEKTLKEFGERYGVVYCTGEPGTVLFNDSDIIHGSQNNMSPTGRCNLYLVYNALSNKPVAPYGGKQPRPEYLSARDPEWQRPLTPLNIEDFE